MSTKAVISEIYTIQGNYGYLIDENKVRRKFQRSEISADDVEKIELYDAVTFDLSNGEVTNIELLKKHKEDFVISF